MARHRPAVGEESPKPPLRIGYSTVHFTEPSPLSTRHEIARRLEGRQLPAGTPSREYRLADESFEAYVPESYTGEKPFGLLVFVSPSASGSLKPYDPGWAAALTERQLLWIGADNSGNDRQVTTRLGLAIDAAVAMRATYRVDPARVYVSGVSGGGRVSSMLGVGYPDLFAGDLSMIGCGFYRDERSRDETRVYPRDYIRPPADLFELARDHRRHVLFTGEKDGNREPIRIFYEAFKRDGFQKCTYLLVPGMGHQAPPAEWFARGLQALDPRGAVETR